MNTPIYCFEIAEIRTFKKKFLYKNTLTNAINYSSGITDSSLERLTARLHTYITSTGGRVSGSELERGTYEISYAIFRMDKANFYKMDETPFYEVSNDAISRIYKLIL